MKQKGLPFVVGMTDATFEGESVSGFRPALVLEVHNGGNFSSRYQGVLAAGLFTLVGSERNEKSSDLEGAALAGLTTVVTDGDLKGLTAAGAINAIGSEVRGVQVSGVFNYAKNLNGAQVAGAVNYAGENLTGVQASAICNRAKSGDKFAVQVGLVNYIQEYKGGVVIQVGLYNRAGGQVCPVLNIRGVRGSKK